MSGHEEKLAAALDRFAGAIERQTRVLEVLTESMPATAEARLLGISDRTVRRYRKQRKAERLMS